MEIVTCHLLLRVYGILSPCAFISILRQIEAGLLIVSLVDPSGRDARASHEIKLGWQASG